MKKSLIVGSKAPDFSLKDASGTNIRLSDAYALGSVVMIFYPGNHTPACTVQLCSIRDDWQAFQKLGINVFGINHADAKSHQTFASVHRFPFPLLIDTNKRVSRRYGAIRSLPKVNIIRRTVFGISPDGIIRYVRRGLPKNAEILKVMKPFAKI